MPGRRPKVVDRNGNLVEDMSIEDKNSLGQVNPAAPQPTPTATPSAEQIIDEEMRKRGMTRTNG